MLRLRVVVPACLACGVAVMVLLLDALLIENNCLLLLLPDAVHGLLLGVEELVTERAGGPARIFRSVEQNYFQLEVSSVIL